MGRVFARRSHSIVAVATASGDVGMIKIGWQPGRACVAVFTDITASDMCRVLASGSHSIVTAAAIANDAGMIEVGRNPPGSRMAVITGIVTAYVRRMFPCRGDTIVAGSAGSDDLSVVDRYRWRERDDTMAVLANRRGLNMRSILTSRIATVVTTDAVARDIDVVKVRRSPGHSRVAIVAGISAADMRWRLAGRDIAIVAGLARSYNLSMINHGGRRPEIHAMTIFTNGGSQYVCIVFAGCVRAVVATGTIAGNARMVEISRCPGDGRVAIVAVVTTC